MSEKVETLKTWEKDGLKLEVKWVRDHYCGYVTFPKKPVIESGYNGIMTYVPVHGGITYAEGNKDGTFTYGFDCAHSGDYVEYSFDKSSALRNLMKSGHRWTEEEVFDETNRLAKGLLAVIKYEKRYLRASTNKGKGKVLDEYYKELGEKFDVTDNFGAALNLLGGRL